MLMLPPAAPLALLRLLTPPMGSALRRRMPCVMDIESSVSLYDRPAGAAHATEHPPGPGAMFSPSDILFLRSWLASRFMNSGHSVGEPSVAMSHKTPTASPACSQVPAGGTAPYPGVSVLCSWHISSTVRKSLHRSRSFCDNDCGMTPADSSCQTCAAPFGSPQHTKREYSAKRSNDLTAIVQYAVHELRNLCTHCTSRTSEPRIRANDRKVNSGGHSTLWSLPIISKAQMANAKMSRRLAYCRMSAGSVVSDWAPPKNRNQDAGPQYRASPVGFSTCHEPSPLPIHARASVLLPKSTTEHCSFEASGGPAPFACSFGSPSVGEYTSKFLALTSRWYAML
mmetsp:Transcript_30972/g.72247  ORF Transcript_30972/g.72247 Transcript_30972/m.72247 type:complete len:340 (+) Transcript_30972:1179-2198(+)